MFGLGLGPEPAQLLRCPRGVLGREPGSLCGGLLGPPVDVVHEAALSHMPRSQARHVRRGDVHQMRSRAAVLDGPQQLLDAPEVGGETRVDRRVERHLAGTVDDDVDIRRNGRNPFEIALKDRDLVAQHPLDTISADSVTPCGEGRLGHETPKAGLSIPACTGTDEDDHPGVGQVGKQPFQQRLAHETGRSRDEDTLAREPLGQPHASPLP